MFTPFICPVQSESILRLMLRYLSDMLDDQRATDNDEGALPGDNGAMGGDTAENLSQVTEMS